MRVLVVNAGSTSLKLRLVGPDDDGRTIEALEDVDEAEVDAVAHRVVHGGSSFRAPVVVDAGVRARIEELAAVAPLHNRPALAGIEAAGRALPWVPHVAVFDTAFHATIPAEAATYAVPTQWREEWGVRRFGFHGLSVAWCAERAPALLGRAAAGLRLVVCHLGGGSSVSAVRDGRSVDTTMGFTPLEGVPMTTRAGSIDAGAIVYALRRGGLDVDSLDEALNTQSGLAALAGGSGDMRDLEAAAGRGEEGARLAVGVYTHRVSAAVAAMAVAAGGLDALVFTAGIGEGSARVRALVCERLRFLGVELDEAANEGAEPDRDVAAAQAPVRVLVIGAREELVAARAARQLLART